MEFAGYQFLKNPALNWAALNRVPEVVAFIREANLQASKAKCKKAQQHLPKRRGRHAPHYKNQDDDKDS